MNIFKTRKSILTILIFTVVTTFTFGMLNLFVSRNIQTINIYAFTTDGVETEFTSFATVSMDSGWSKTSNGVYSSNINKGLSSSSKIRLYPVP